MFVPRGVEEKIPLDGRPRIPWIALDLRLASVPERESVVARIETLRGRVLVRLVAGPDAFRLLTDRHASAPFGDPDSRIEVSFGWSDPDGAVELLAPVRELVPATTPDPALPTRLSVGGEVALLLGGVGVATTRPHRGAPPPADAVFPLSAARPSVFVR